MKFGVSEGTNKIVNVLVGSCEVAELTAANSYTKEVTLGYVPKGARIIKACCKLKVALNATGTPSITVDKTLGSTKSVGALLAAGDITEATPAEYGMAVTKGHKIVTETTWGTENRWKITATVTGDSGSTTGSMVFEVHYVE